MYMEYQIVKQIGNYEEIYEKYLGTKTPLNLKRGYNKLYTEEVYYSGEY